MTCGCKKEKPPAGQPPASPDSAVAADASQPPPSFGAPTPTPPPPVVVSASADTKATLRQLTLELRKFVVRTRTVPKTFEEFLALSRIQVPPPPPGKKYAIQNQAVVLVNQ